MRRIGSVEILGEGFGKSEKQIPHPRKTAGFGMTFILEWVGDVNRARWVLVGGPVGGFVVAGGGELVGRSAVGEHGPDLAGAGASGFKGDVATVGGPGGALIAAGIASELEEMT